MRPIVVITGGSRGIGAACAHLAAARGYDVAIHFAAARDAADAVVHACAAAGARAIAVQGDIAGEADVIDLFERVDRDLGRTAALINNAGIVFRNGPIHDFDAERLNRLWAVNITGMFLAAREALKRMSRDFGGPGGAIVNIGSAASRLGGGGVYIDYAASKGAIDVFNQGLAQEVAGQGVRVNALRPGLIETDIHADMGVPDRVAKLSSSVPIGRAGTPEDVAEAALWLLSDAAAYITGSIIEVAGGR